MTDSHTIGYPDEEPSDGHTNRVQCPACQHSITFNSYVDLYRNPCNSCGKFSLLYFWGKKNTPHFTEDIVYLLCEEGLLTEEHLETALQTKKQSSNETFIDFLLSIHYVTRQEVIELAQQILPSPWVEIFDSSRSAHEEEEEKDPLLRSELSRHYEMMDKALMEHDLEPSSIRAREAERILMGLGADLTAQETRTRLGILFSDENRFPLSLSEDQLAFSFSKFFDLDYNETAPESALPSLPQDLSLQTLHELRVIPLNREDDILELGISAHLLLLGLGSSLQLQSPRDIISEIDTPVSFTILPFETLLEAEENLYGDTGKTLSDLNDILRNVREHVLQLLEERESLSPEESPVESTVIRHWLYHPEANQIIPKILRQTDLDSLNIWFENQKPSLSEEELQDPPEVPPEDQEEFSTLKQALKQLYEKGQVFPDALDISNPTLEEITETLAEVYKAVPIAKVGGFLWVCIEETKREERLTDLAMILGSPVRGLKGDGESIVQMLVRQYGLTNILEDPDRIMQDQQEVHRLYSEEEVSPDPEAINLLPAQIAHDLDIVPIEETENEVKIACCYPIDFFNRKMLKLMLDKSLRFFRTEDRVISSLLEEHYSLDDVDQSLQEHQEDGNGTYSQPASSLSESFHIEDLEGIKPLQNQLHEMGDTAAALEYVSSRRKLLDDPLLSQNKGTITLRNENWNPPGSNIWTPAMTRLFQAVPLRTKNNTLEVLASMESRWSLEHLPIFTRSPVTVKILSQSTMSEIQNTYLDEVASDGSAKNDSEERRFDLSQSSSTPIPSEVVERAGKREFLQLSFLLYWHVMHASKTLIIDSAQNTCVIATKEDGERKTLDYLHHNNTAPLIYQMQLISGVPHDALLESTKHTSAIIYQGSQQTLEMNTKVSDQTKQLELHPEN